MYIVQFGGYTLPTEQLDMEESQGASRRGARVLVPGRGGAIDLVGLGPDPLAVDSISKSFIISAASASALQTAVDSFIGEMMLSQNDANQGERVLVAQLPDGSYRGTWAKCTEARARMEYFHQQNGWLPVSVTWERKWPVWWDYEDMLFLGDHLGTFAEAATAGWDFGQNVAEQAISSTTTEFTITNGGNGRVFDGMIEFDGAIGNPKVKNLTNEHQFSWAGTLSSGDRFTLDIATYTAKKNGTSGEWSNITLGTAWGQIQPFRLEPGANEIKITNDSGASCTFRLYYAEAYF
jgi:hypothetical protein